MYSELYRQRRRRTPASRRYANIYIYRYRPRRQRALVNALFGQRRPRQFVRQPQPPLVTYLPPEIRNLISDYLNTL